MPPSCLGKVRAIAVIQLFCGIQTLIITVTLAVGSLFLYLPWIYGLVVGIMAIVRGSKLMGVAAYGAGTVSPSQSCSS